MGNKTLYWASVKIEPSLSQAEIDYLTEFSETRRMLRKNGPYFVGGTGMRGQNENDPDVILGNQPPLGQPSLWCQWLPTENGHGLEWDRNFTFQGAPEWMLYLIQNFLGPGAIAVGEVPGIVGGHMLSGFVEVVNTEQPGRHGVILVEDNKVYFKYHNHPDKGRIRPEFYKIDVYSKETGRVASELFGINHPLLQEPPSGKVLTVATPTDLETGLPTRTILLIDGYEPIARWYIDDAGKAHRVGMLEWYPSEEA